MNQGIDTITRTILALLRLHHPYTAGHVARTASYAVRVARYLGWTGKDLDLIRFGALLHDTGKLTTPTAILSKPSRLDDSELRVMVRHMEAGYRMLKNLNVNEFIARAALLHHEKFNGTGRPYGIAAPHIGRIPQIVSIADALDAMTSDRGYNNPMTLESAIHRLLINDAGTDFDPWLLDAFRGSLIR